MTTRDPEQIVIAANGGVAIAPVGTTLPTTAGDALDAAFADLGYISDAGVIVGNKIDSTGLPAWQSLADVRRIITKAEFTAKFDLLQWNKNTLPLAFGGGLFTDHGNGEWEYALPAPGEQTDLAMVIDAQDGNNNYRIVLPRVTLSDLGDINFLRSDAAKLPITIAALAGDDGRPARVYGKEGGSGTGSVYTPTILHAASDGDTPSASDGAIGDVFEDKGATSTKVYIKTASAWGTGTATGVGVASLAFADVDPTTTPPASSSDGQLLLVPAGRTYALFFHENTAAGWTDLSKTLAVPANAPIYPDGNTG